MSSVSKKNSSQKNQSSEVFNGGLDILKKVLAYVEITEQS